MYPCPTINSGIFQAWRRDFFPTWNDQTIYITLRKAGLIPPKLCYISKMDLLQMYGSLLNHRGYSSHVSLPEAICKEKAGPFAELWSCGEWVLWEKWSVGPLNPYGTYVYEVKSSSTKQDGLEQPLEIELAVIFHAFLDFWRCICSISKHLLPQVTSSCSRRSAKMAWSSSSLSQVHMWAWDHGPLKKLATNLAQLMVNWWFGARWFGALGQSQNHQFTTH